MIGSPNARQLRQFVAPQKMPGRIVRIHQHNRARALVDGALDRVEIDEPAVVVKQSVVPHRHRFERGEVIEQRIRRARHEHLIAADRTSSLNSHEYASLVLAVITTRSTGAPYSRAMVSRAEGNPKGSGS